MQLEKVSSVVVLSSLALTTVLPLAIVLVSLVFSTPAFPWKLFLVITFIVALTGGGITLAVLRNGMYVEQGMLKLRAAFYTRTLPVDALLLQEAVIVSPGDRTHAPVIRTNGVGLPGYQAGWFRARDREKLFVAAPRTPANLYIPTTHGYALLLAVEDPAGTLHALQSSRGSAGAAPGNRASEGIT